MSKVIDNILAKYRAFGFDPPLHPDKYLVPMSINEFAEVVNEVHHLKSQLAEAEKVIEKYAETKPWSMRLTAREYFKNKKDKRE